MIQMIGGDGVNKVTANAGTRIQVAVGGVGGLFTHLLNLRYTDTGTAHTLTVLRAHPNQKSKASAKALAAATSVVLDSAPAKSDGTAPANLDLFSFKLDNGTWHLSTISAWDSATFTLTLNTAIPTGRSVLKGAPVFLHGVAADTYHANEVFTGGSGSSAVNFPAANTPDVSLCRSAVQGAPIVLDSNNATNAGTFNTINVGYSKR